MKTGPKLSGSMFCHELPGMELAGDKDVIHLYIQTFETVRKSELPPRALIAEPCYLHEPATVDGVSYIGLRRDK